MSLGTLTIDLAANVARLSSDLGKANRLAEKSAAQMEKRFSQMKTVLGTMFAGLSVGAFAAWIKQSIDAADQVNELSQKINVNAESLQKWGFAASVSGGSMEDTATAIKKLSVNISDAANGSDSAKAKFDAIGVSFLDSSGKIRTADSVMLDIADRFQSTANDANKTATAIDLFGKSGTSMIPVLNEGSVSLQEMMQQAQDLGLVMSQESLTAADNFNDSLTTLSGISRGYANHIAAELLPTLNTLTGYLIDTSTSSDTASNSMSGLDMVLRSLIVTGISVGAVFNRVGNVIGAVAASAVMAAQGEFSKAADIARMSQEDSAKDIEDTLNRISSVWDGTYQKMGAKAAEVNNKIKPSLKGVSDTQNELTDLTKKHAAEIAGVTDKQYAYNQKISELKTLLDSGQISQENYAKAVSAAGAELNKTSKHTDAAASAAKRHAEAIASEIQQLEFKAATLGMTDSQTELYKLATEGATQAQLDHSKALLDQVDTFEKNKKAKEDAADYQKELNDKMRQYDELITGAKSGTTEYGQTLYDLNKLLEAGKINHDEYSAAIERAKQKYDEAGKSAIDWGKVQEDAINAGKDALADFLYDPLDGGFKGMVSSFTDALRKMSAQAAAAGIMESIFSKENMSSLSSWFSNLLGMTGGTGGATSAGGAGALSGIMGSIGSLFSFDGGGYTGDGARSGGMDGKGGFMAMIHPNEQIIDYTKPVYNSSQESSSRASGRTTINQVINTTGKIDNRTSNQIATDTARKQRLARSRLGG